jgi:hypothetical protein
VEPNPVAIVSQVRWQITGSISFRLTEALDPAYGIPGYASQSKEGFIVIAFSPEHDPAKQPREIEVLCVYLCYKGTLHFTRPVFLACDTPIADIIAAIKEDLDIANPDVMEGEIWGKGHRRREILAEYGCPDVDDENPVEGVTVYYEDGSYEDVPVDDCPSGEDRHGDVHSN